MTIKLTPSTASSAISMAGAHSVHHPTSEGRNRVETLDTIAIPRSATFREVGGGRDRAGGRVAHCQLR